MSKTSISKRTTNIRGVFDALRHGVGESASIETLYSSIHAVGAVERIAANAKFSDRLIKPAIRELRDSDGKVMDNVIHWTVPTDNVYPLAGPDGKPFTVSRFTCSFDQIAWQAGQGWPVYTTRCPRNDFLPNGFFKDARAHQLVPWVKGVSYGIGCDNPAPYVFGASGPLYVGVNDGTSDYGDNRGTFNFTVYNYAT
jgi:hypothetical protein